MMKISKFRKNYRIYQVSLIVMVMTIGLVSFYFWKNGFTDGSRSQAIIKSNYIIEKIKTKKPLKAVKKQIWQENKKIALEQMDNLERDLVEIDSLIGDSDFELVLGEHKTVQANAAKLISFSKTEKVLNILKKKIDSFYYYVKVNEWKTLTRSTDRLKSRVEHNRYDDKNLSTLIKFAKKESDLMIEVTQNSVLSKAEKKKLIDKLNSMQTEVSMLKRYTESRDKFFQSLEAYFQTMHAWIDKVLPQLAQEKLRQETVVSSIIQILSIVSAFGVLFFGLSYIWERKISYRKRQEEEESIENLLLGYFEGSQQFDEQKYSKIFIQKMRKIKSGLDKKVSFGSILEEGLPLASTVLNENLKCVWANNHFEELFNIDENEIKKDYFTWDFLAEKLSLDSSNPVLDAYENKVSSMLQLSFEEKSFELYVNPVSSEKGTFVMLSFYRTDVVEDKVTDHANSLIKPIRKAINSMLEDDFYDGQRELVKVDFCDQNLDDIFEKLSKVADKHREKRAELFSEIELLGTKLNHFEKMFKSLNQTYQIQGKSVQDYKQVLISFRDDIVKLMDVYEKKDSLIGEGFESILGNSSDLLIGHQALVTELSLYEDINELAQSLPALREHMQEVSSRVHQRKRKLLSAVDELARSSKGPLNKWSDKEKSRLVELKQQFGSLSESLEQFIAVSKKIDIKLMKWQMISREGNFSDFEKTLQANIRQANKISLEGKSLVKNFDELSAQSKVFEDNLVSHLRVMYDSNNLSSQALIGLGEIVQKSQELDSLDKTAIN